MKLRCNIVEVVGQIEHLRHSFKTHLKYIFIELINELLENSNKMFGNKISIADHQKCIPDMISTN